MVVSSGLGFRAPAETPQVLAFMVFDLQIRQPVRVGDTIRCRVRVAGKRPMKEGGVIVERRMIVDTVEGILSNPHPWIHEYFHGARARSVAQAKAADHGA